MPRGVRPDAVPYLLVTLKQFDAMTRDEMQKIAFEIPVLGQGGLNTNDPVPKYRLKSLPGDFSGLHLVSIMNVAFDILSPGQSIGFDLGREYTVAKKMFG